VLLLERRTLSSFIFFLFFLSQSKCQALATMSVLGEVTIPVCDTGCGMVDGRITWSDSVVEGRKYKHHHLRVSEEYHSSPRNLLFFSCFFLSGKGG
jgi:hypothetical protein